mmetsp:Transcript_27399/g.86846  ORF Transcript_27399/g.86846 Transcript_27399/m.86846 type:complete len:232 (-) Transcript_27399:184-879(-)
MPLLGAPALGRLLVALAPPWSAAGVAHLMGWLLVGESVVTILLAATRGISKHALCWRAVPDPPEPPHPLHILAKSWSLVEPQDTRIADKGFLVYTYTTSDDCFTYRYVYNFKWVPVLMFLWCVSVIICLRLIPWLRMPVWRLRVLRPFLRFYRKMRFILLCKPPINPIWEKGDLCPICLNEMMSPRCHARRAEDAVVYCKYGCGKVVHKACMRQWIEQRSVCVYCQAEWHE